MYLWKLNEKLKRPNYIEENAKKKVIEDIKTVVK